MKRFFFIVLLLVCFLSFLGSCTKNEASGIVGKWVPTDNKIITFYWEFTTDNQLRYYELRAPEGTDYHDYQWCSYDNGTLYVPKDYTWRLQRAGEYMIEDNCIFFSGYNMGEITRVNKDKYVFDSDLLIDGVVERVKKFATK